MRTYHMSDNALCLHPTASSAECCNGRLGYREDEREFSGVTYQVLCDGCIVGRKLWDSHVQQHSMRASRCRSTHVQITPSLGNTSTHSQKMPMASSNSITQLQSSCWHATVCHLSVIVSTSCNSLGIPRSIDGPCTASNKCWGEFLRLAQKDYYKQELSFAQKVLLRSIRLVRKLWLS